MASKSRYSSMAIKHACCASPAHPLLARRAPRLLPRRRQCLPAGELARFRRGACILEAAADMPGCGAKQPRRHADRRGAGRLFGTAGICGRTAQRRGCDHAPAAAYAAGRGAVRQPREDEIRAYAAPTGSPLARTRLQQQAVTSDRIESSSGPGVKRAGRNAPTPGLLRLSKCTRSSSRRTQGEGDCLSIEGEGCRDGASALVGVGMWSR
jgi:hypothetical protein